MRDSQRSRDSDQSLNDTPDNLVEMAQDFLKTSRAVNLMDRVNGKAFLDTLVDANMKLAYGDKYQPPKRDDMISVDSPTTTTITNNYPAKPTPTWVKAACITAGLLGAGGAVAGLLAILRPPASAPPAPSNPTPKPTPTPGNSGLEYELTFPDV